VAAPLDLVAHVKLRTHSALVTQAHSRKTGYGDRRGSDLIPNSRRSTVRAA
jgi:hypothetical protein